MQSISKNLAPLLAYVVGRHCMGVYSNICVVARGHIRAGECCYKVVGSCKVLTSCEVWFSTSSQPDNNLCVCVCVIDASRVPGEAAVISTAAQHHSETSVDLWLCYVIVICSQCTRCDSKWRVCVSHSTPQNDTEVNSQVLLVIVSVWFAGH